MNVAKVCSTWNALHSQIAPHYPYVDNEAGERSGMELDVFHVERMRPRFKTEAETIFRRVHRIARLYYFPAFIDYFVLFDRALE